MYFTSGKFIGMYISIFFLFAIPQEVISGEWCCDEAVGVYAGLADPITSCQNMGLWQGKTQTEEEYLRCALGDLEHSYDYRQVMRDYEASYYAAFVSGIVRAYNKYPKLRPEIINFLVSKRYYEDIENRKTFDDIVQGSAHKDIWQMLKDAYDKKPCGPAKLYYQYCKNGYIEEYIAVYPPTLDEIIDCQKSPSLNAFNGDVKCIKVQSEIMNKLTDLILEDQIIKKEYLALLESHRIRYIRNAVFAKHGRAFSDNKISNYFKRRDWYKVNENYSDSLLTSNDKKNLSLIAAYESSLK